MNKIAFFLIFAVGGIAFAFIGYNSMQKAKAAKAWPTVEGRITSSEVDSYWKRDRDSGSTRMHEAKIAYEYTVDGVSYESTKISFMSSSSSLRGQAQAMVRKYPAGGTATVYYNPSNPQEAVLEPGAAGGAMIFMAAGGIFALIGIFGSLFGNPTLTGAGARTYHE